MREFFGQGSSVPQPRFALAFVPTRWSSELGAIVEALVAALRWPRFAPLVAVLSDSASLTVCTALADGAGAAKARPPRVFFLGKKELDQVSVLSLNPELRSTNTMKVNGTVLATQAYLQREPQEVGSLLLFGDLSAGMKVVNRALANLDVAYPNATKAGLLVTRVENSPSMAVGFGGRVALKEGGVLGLALPGLLHSAIAFCGCRPIGMPMEVHEADLQYGGFIRTVGTGNWDGESWGVPGVVESAESSLPPRRQSIPAATALGVAADAAGFEDDADFWIGVPRGFKYDKMSFKRAPGAGEWALYKWSATTAEGTVVLEGEGPQGDGLGKKGIHRIQGFVSQADHSAIGQLAQTYALERLAREPPGAPLATLLLAGGPGAVASVADEALYEGCAMGLGVIGCAGLTIGLPGLEGTGSFSYSVAKIRPTAVHRQAAGLLYFRC